MLDQPRIAVLPATPGLYEEAANLAQKLNLPLVMVQSTEQDYLLIQDVNHICLSKTVGHERPLTVDFLSTALKNRQQNASLKKETLLRALGLKAHQRPSIIDATGGLAQDSLIIATLGFAVTVLERSPIIYTLLADGIRRARPHLPALERVHLVHADAITWIPGQPRPDIIYLDPMFPVKKKTALAKKSMQFLQDVLSADTDSEQLFATSLTCALQRVVVKRPRTAKFITLKPPSYSLVGSSSRFDVYLK